MRVVIPFILWPVVTLGSSLFFFEQSALCPHTHLCGLGPADREFNWRSGVTSPSMEAMGYVLLVAGIVTILSGSALTATWLYKSVKSGQQRALEKLIELIAEQKKQEEAADNADEGGPRKGRRRFMRGRKAKKDREEAMQAHAVATTRVFMAFDLDRSQELSMKELRTPRRPHSIWPPRV